MIELGRTGLKISRIGLGGLFLASFAAELEIAKRTVKSALDLGINFIDTAPGYSNSEEVLGKALADIDRPIVISTKLGGRPTPFNAQDKALLRTSFEMSLKLLGRDFIDILFIHEPDRPGQYDWWTDMREVRGPVLDFLDELKEDGLIKATGIGGTTVSEMAHLCRSGKFDVVLTAFNYSLLYREAALEVIPAAQAQGMGILLGSPLQQGVFARRFDELIDNPKVYWISQARKAQFRELYQFADEAGMALPEMAIRFAASNPDIHCVLMGARNPEEVQQNVAAMNKGPLPQDILDRLDEIAAKVPQRPFCEPFGMGWHMREPHKYKGPGVA